MTTPPPTDGGRNEGKRSNGRPFFARALHWLRSELVLVTEIFRTARVAHKDARRQPPWEYPENMPPESRHVEDQSGRSK